jgi:DNA-binding MarR family transcriptional regulator
MMNFDSPNSTLPQALAGALRRLAQLAHTSSWDQWAIQRLTPTQRKILQILGSRSESLSLSAVARELGVTAATACDSVSALESKKLICKRRSTTDGRALALVLTEEGQQAATQLASLPDPLWGAFDALAHSEQEALYRLSIKMIRGLQESGALPTSRMCVRCKYFDPFRFESSATPHYCHLAQTPFAEGQLRIDCAVFEAGDTEKQTELWERFVAKRGGESSAPPIAPAHAADTQALEAPAADADVTEDMDAVDQIDAPHAVHNTHSECELVASATSSGSTGTLQT